MNWVKSKTIVVPTDLSDESARAVTEAMKLVESPSQLQVIHVIEDTVAHLSDIPVGKTKHDVRVRLAKEQLRDESVEYEHKGVHAQTCVGDPGTEIAKYAENVGAGLILMPSHGRSGFLRLWIGSVAERVVRLARCPVLILKSMTRPGEELPKPTAESALAVESRQPETAHQ